MNLNKCQISRCLQGVIGNHCVDALAIEYLQGGRTNCSYKVSLRGHNQSHVLRFFVQNPEARLRELQLTKILSGQVPIARVLYSSDGLEENVPPYTVTTFVPGTHPAKLFVRFPQRAYTVGVALGECLAQMNTFVFDSPGRLTPKLSIAKPFESNTQSYLDYMSWCLFNSAAGKRLGTTLRESVWRAVQDHFHCLRETDSNFSLVHGDYKSENLLVNIHNDDVMVNAVLDWEFAHSGTPLSDIADIFYSSPEMVSKEFQQGLLVGYETAGGELPENWEKIAKLFALKKYCGMMIGSGCNTPPRSIIKHHIRILIDDMAGLNLSS